MAEIPTTICPICNGYLDRPGSAMCGRRHQSTAETRWAPAKFYRAVHGAAPIEEWGYEWRGLVLRHSGWATPRTKTKWTLIHIGSGGTIMRFTGNIATVFPVAGEIAECGDFTLFDLPNGWRQTDPELPAKIAAICDAHPEASPDTSWSSGPAISADDARAVIEARETASAN